MKKTALILLVLSLLSLPLLAQPQTEAPAAQKDTILFTDSCGRTVEIPSNLTKVAPSGAVATMFLASVAPEYMTNVNSSPTNAQMQYLPSVLATLPATGQLYGSKATLNTEEILQTGAEIIIDIGDYKKGIEEDLDALQAQTGIPCIFLEGDLEHMASAFRSLGTILSGKRERAEELASAIEETLTMTKENSRKVKDDEKLSVMYTQGPDGLGTNAKGSSQAQVIELIGATNAIVVDNVSQKGGGTLIGLEQLLAFNPDVILFLEGSIYSTVSSDSVWSILDAVKNGRYHEVPSLPYNWMSNPPSMNMVLGVWWLGNLLYPQYYDYDMREVAKAVYSLFWNYTLSDEDVDGLLARSTVKR
ncbi:MAG: ABC transporter substrate-binding protein [Spirochaetales bacterium]|nr:ABC transporter substrate-binding protein [Candidatus Physcosoma equi]